MCERQQGHSKLDLTGPEEAGGEVAVGDFLSAQGGKEPVGGGAVRHTRKA